MFPDLLTMGVALLVLLTAGLALLAAFLVWRDGYVRGWRSSRTRPPACPSCGYNLSGLTRCRCPECGTEYSIDELWQSILPLGKSSPRHVESTQPVRKGQQTT